MEHTCPICGRASQTRNGVRRHLHVTHRKFEILDALLAADEAATTEEEEEAPLREETAPA